jgi:hypothetical protein
MVGMPRTMDAWSCGLMMPWWHNISAWASEPAMSTCHRRLSKNTLEV